MLNAILIVFLILLIACSAFLSATETAFFSLSSMKVRAFKQGKDKKALIAAKLISKPRNLLVTLLMLNILMNILVQNVVSTIFGTLSGLLLNVGVPLVLTLVFGEVIPKSIALVNNAKMACIAAPPINAIYKVVSPLRIIITFVTNIISRMMFFFLKKESSISLPELKHALKTSKKFGFLNPEEAKLIRGYLNLDEDHVKEVTTPRGEMIAHNIKDPIENLYSLFVDKECSRVPVYEEELENILGILSCSLFFMHQDSIQKPEDIRQYLEKPFYVPETTGAKMLLCQFYEREQEMAIVVDEYGALSGLITIEDLIEVVVGQIADRRDEKTLYTKAGEDVIIASGKLELAEFEEIFDKHLESESNMATIGGWLTEKLGDIPKEGTKYVSDDFLYHILASDHRRIRRVYIRRLMPSAQSKKKKEAKSE